MFHVGTGFSLLVQEQNETALGLAGPLLLKSHDPAEGTKVLLTSTIGLDEAEALVIVPVGQSTLKFLAHSLSNHRSLMRPTSESAFNTGLVTRHPPSHVR